MEKDKALQILIDIKKVITRLNKNYFLIDGTLLGAIREKDFIEYDNDLDVGVFAEQWEWNDITIFISEMRKIEFDLYHQYGIFGECFELSLKRDDIKIDFFFYNRSENKRIFHAFLRGGQDIDKDLIEYEYPASIIENLSLIEFLGNEFTAPEKAKEVLFIKYGKDWKIPIKNWDWATSPKNIVKKI